MSHPQTDFTAARTLMVDGQVRPNKVTDPRVLAAMGALPRERFVPADRTALAYSDEDVPLGGGRYLIEPMVIARLVQMAAVRAGERALVVGAGTGYGAALLAACGASVVALEQDADLLAIARTILPGLAPGVTLVEGSLAEGWKAAAPYDIVLIEGAVPEIPAAILAQLRGDGGRLVTVLKPDVRVGRAVLCNNAGGGRMEPQPVFDCAIPILPMLQRAPGFVF
ncbi:MAG: protein-L-isoaspartate O-methyltransferase [Acetobacteraceae bacterium]|nr:protein-L-isoaspartate O-methyltransferase [Acetobacteraceae bacterium]